jgi:hypothetical protein
MVRRCSDGRDTEGDGTDTGAASFGRVEVEPDASSVAAPGGGVQHLFTTDSHH